VEDDFFRADGQTVMTVIFTFVSCILILSKLFTK